MHAAARDQLQYVIAATSIETGNFEVVGGAVSISVPAMTKGGRALERHQGERRQRRRLHRSLP